MSTNAMRGKVSREAIRQTALGLFAERGYRATTMSDIGEALGVRGPSLYKHVPSKQELLAEIMLATMTALLDNQRSALAAGGGAQVRLRRFVEGHVRYHATHREHAFVGNREIDSLDEPTRGTVLGMRREYEHNLRALIEEGSSSGDFSVPNAKLVSFAILDLGMGVATWYRRGGEYGVEQLAYAYADLASAMVGVS